MKTTRIIIFAKAPLAGFAKTRLIPALGAELAAQLARRMLLHTMEQALLVENARVELCVTPAIHDQSWQDIPIASTIVCTEQGSGDLGERLARASSRALTTDQSVLLVGTDCPDLNKDFLQKAQEALSTSDSVLVPTFDGGYALLGIREFHPSIFEKIHWSTSTVAGETQDRIKSLSWACHVLPTLHDIDEPDDLQWLPPAFR